MAFVAAYDASKNVYLSESGPGAGSNSRHAAPQLWPPASIEYSATHRADKVAVVDGAHTITYGQFAIDAGLLATCLRAMSVGPEAVVGICLNRSIDRLVAMLAVMQAGGAFLPLDPAWPVERLRTILRDAGTALIIGPADLRAQIGSGHRWLAFDHAAAPMASFTAPENDAASEPERLAYVIYTSGSTGSPNGVEITCGNLRHLIGWHLDEFGLSENDRVSHVAGLGFDAAQWEIWPSLSAGATIVLADDAVRTSVPLLQDFLIAQRISVAFAPTVLAEGLLAADWPADTDLRLLLTGGDALQGRPRAGLPFAVINNYGPTECTVVATSGRVASNEDLPRPDIGRPIARTQIHILDPRGAHVADGVIGEFHIAGAGVGRGYRRRPDLTAARFLTDGCGSHGGRIFRTGDLGRRLPDGRLEFVGRRDNQEKIRGFRVAPEEVEACLAHHAGVAACAVAGYNDAARQRQLAAYIVPRPDSVPSGGDLLEFLADRLPDYMCPAAFVRMSALPVNGNGKLDRASLPTPCIENALGAISFRVPATPTENRVACIIAELIGLPMVGAGDNFFLLGGHSLLGTQLVLRVRDVFDVEITLRQVFESQTVSGLASVIEARLLERLEQISEADAVRLLAS
jgi:amino acid adenylation domain-containing protein